MLMLANQEPEHAHERLAEDDEEQRHEHNGAKALQWRLEVTPYLHKRSIHARYCTAVSPERLACARNAQLALIITT
jgi:hypothetical protein